MVRIIILLILSILSTAVHADWKDSFYTDESEYYLRLFKDGFSQRFRVDKKYCDVIKSAEVILKKEQRHYSFQQVRVLDSKWPRLYGITDRDVCWFQVRVKGLDLNKPLENHYVIKIDVKNSDPLYFADYITSILPKDRLKSKVDALDNWISLGRFGATPVEGGGVFFKIWEPLANRVDLFFQRAPTHAYWMFPTTTNDLDNERSFVLYVDDVEVGDEYHYKFLKNGKYESLEVANDIWMSDWKVDPMAKRVNYDTKGGAINGYHHPRAVITGDNTYRWKNDGVSSSLNIGKGEHLIYQMWPATFNPPQYAGRYEVGTFNSILPKIPYISDLGMNTIELLPIHETRFHASWGYALDSLLAVDRGLGSRNDLKSLVDQFHKNRMKVFFDVVINHVNNDLLREPLAVGVTRTKFFDGNTPWGPKPDFKNIMVKRWIADSLVSLMRDYHIDGYRFDMTSAVHNTEGGFRFLAELNQIFKMNHPDFYSSAEELPDNIYITKPASEGGADFDAQWNDKFKNFFEENFNYYRANSRWVDVQPLKDAMIGFSDQSHYGDLLHFGPADRTVNYLGSHDFIGNKNPILRIVSDYAEKESEDHNTFYQVNPMDGEDPQSNFHMIHNRFTHSVAKLSYGVLFTKPGSILFYQGEELGNDINIENEWSYLAAKKGNTTPSKNINLHRFIGSHRMVWHYLNRDHNMELSFLTEEDKKILAGHQLFFKEMLAFRKKFKGISFHNAFNVQTNHKASIISYQITDGQNDFFVIANYGEAQGDYWIDFPFSSHGSWWTETINSSAPRFGGEGIKYSNIISQKGGRANMIRLAPTSLHIFQAMREPTVKQPLYWASNLSEWSTVDRYKLHEIDNGIYIVDFELNEAKRVMFKVSTKNWGIEMGEGDESHMTYGPDEKNVEISLPHGSYRFTFNVLDFSYKIEDLRKLDYTSQDNKE